MNHVLEKFLIIFLIFSAAIASWSEVTPISNGRRMAALQRFIGTYSATNAQGQEITLSIFPNLDSNQLDFMHLQSHSDMVYFGLEISPVYLNLRGYHFSETDTSADNYKYLGNYQENLTYTLSANGDELTSVLIQEGRNRRIVLSCKMTFSEGQLTLTTSRIYYKRSLGFGGLNEWTQDLDSFNGKNNTRQQRTDVFLKTSNVPISYEALNQIAARREKIYYVVTQPSVGKPFDASQVTPMTYSQWQEWIRKNQKGRILQFPMTCQKLFAD